MTIDKKYVDQFINVTSKAALASSYLVGKKDKIAADQAAVDSMRFELNRIEMNGQVVIGEGALDEAPLLYTGEKLGTQKGPNFDIAVDPVEGTNFVANNLPGGISVLAIAEKGNLFNAPETYMDKLATCKIDKGLVDLDYPIEKNIKEAKSMGIEDLDKKYDLSELVKGDSLFCATGITNSDILNGIKVDNNEFLSETLVTHKNSNLKKVVKNVISLNE